MRTSFGIFIFVQILFIAILCITCFFMICLKSSLLNGIFRAMARNRKLEGEHCADSSFYKLKHLRNECIFVWFWFKNYQRRKWYYRRKNFGLGEFRRFKEWVVLWSWKILFVWFSQFYFRDWSFQSNLSNIRNRSEIRYIYNMSHMICNIWYAAYYMLGVF